MPLHSPVFLSELETAGFPVNDRSGKVPKQMTSGLPVDERNPGAFQGRIDPVSPKRIWINRTTVALTEHEIIRISET